jgi:hypothetical protein
MLWSANVIGHLNSSCKTRFSGESHLWLTTDGKGVAFSSDSWQLRC